MIDGIEWRLFFQEKRDEKEPLLSTYLLVYKFRQELKNVLEDREIQL